MADQDDTKNESTQPGASNDGGTLGSAAASVAGAVGKKAATKAATEGAAAVVGGTAAKVGAKALEVGKDIADGNALGAADAAVNAAAVAAVSAAATPLAGAAASAVLDTKIGRKATRATTWIIIAAAMVPVIFVVAALLAVGGAVSMVLAGSASQQLCVDPAGGGIPISDTAKQANALTIIQLAYDRKLGTDGAVIAVMTALAESGLDPSAKDALQGPSVAAPMLSAGVFQQKPFYWAHEFWPAGTQVGDANYTNPSYVVPATAAVMDVSYAAGKFFDRFDSNSKLSGGKWKKMAAWDVAQEIQKSSIASGSNYAAQWAAAKSTVATILVSHPEITTGASSATPTPAAPPTGAPGGTPTPGATSDATGQVGCGNMFGNYAGWGNFAIPAGLVGKFVDGPIIYPKTAIALARATSYVGHAGLACSDGQCRQLCDHLSGEIWGYSASGYVSARVHWQTAMAQGIAHPGDTNPPIGALLFWDTGSFGHVATYIGGGYVVSNLNGPNGYNVYKVPAEYFSKTWGAPYYGWAPPVYFNSPPGSGL